jgi:hypothetical protein
VADEKCPIHSRKLEPARSAPSFSWATGYNSLGNLGPIKPRIMVCPEPGCEVREFVKD